MEPWRELSSPSSENLLKTTKFEAREKRAMAAAKQVSGVSFLSSIAAHLSSLGFLSLK